MWNIFVAQYLSRIIRHLIGNKHIGTVNGINQQKVVALVPNISVSTFCGIESTGIQCPEYEQWTMGERTERN
jgi:hypothetical protein